MGNSTKRCGFSWRSGSSASSGLMVAATAGLGASSVLCTTCWWLASIWASREARSASKGAFSLSEAAKSSFLTGDSILKASIAEAACKEGMPVSSGCVCTR